MNEQKPKIFLSYAREDIDMAKKLYQDLKRYELDVWIDCERILPGQNWKIITEKSIRQSQYFLLLLSSNSVTKRGFIQKEMKIAYEMLEQCSEEDIYMIPVRLNECEPSLKIRDIHYIDVFPESEYQKGLQKILQVVCKKDLLLRNKPKLLSEGDASDMIRRFDFYDRHKNPESEGFNNKYKLQEIKGDKIVFDEATGLMWQQGGYSGGAMRFVNAKNWIKEINQNRFAGFQDWRLPTLEEAMSLMEPEEKKGLYINPVFDKEQDHIWTADQINKGKLQAAWIVDFNGGECYWNYFFHGHGYVRAVRSGKSSQE